MSALILDGPEFLINTTTRGNQNSPTITALGDEHFVVAWTDFSSSGGDISGASIRGQVFGVDGTLIGSEFLINTTRVRDQVDPTIGAASAGNIFFVSWTDFSGSRSDGSGAAIRVQAFLAPGWFLGGGEPYAEYSLDTPASDSQFEPAITRLSDGRLVVVWTEDRTTGGETSGTTIRGQFIGTREASGSDFSINAAPSGQMFRPAIAALSDGRFVVVWTDASATGDDTSGSAIRGQVFTNNGEILGAEFLINNTTANSQSEPTITGLPDGRFVVAWTDNSATNGDTSGSAIRGQVFAGNGAPSGSEFLINTTVANSQSEPTIAGLADGRFVVAWTDASATGEDGSGSAIRGQVFGIGGAPSGPEFIVNTTTANSQSQPMITALPDGRFVVVWTDASATGGDTSGTAIRGQIIDPLVGEIYGGDGDDSLLGGNGNDTLHGGAGLDFLFGGTDDDVLYGGEGVGRRYFDMLPMLSNHQGGRGGGWVTGDWVLGEDGNDLLFGGDGNDTLDGGNGNDTLYGGAGRGFLLGGAGNDLIYAGLEVGRIDGGTGDDTLYGSDDDDIFVASSGNDVYFGGAGTDTFNVRFGHQVSRLILDEAASIEHLSSSDGQIDGTSADDIIDLSGLQSRSSVSGYYRGPPSHDLHEGNDSFHGARYGDDVRGGDGNDVLNGNGGSDSLYGGDGADSILGGTNTDLVWGGTGDDTLRGGSSSDTVRGEDGDDLIHGDSSGDSIYGGAGDDTIDGGSSADTIHGEDGNDRLIGSGSSDKVFGGVGDDYIDGGSSADELYGGDGADSILGGTNTDLVWAGADNDTVRGGTSSDTIAGEDGDDLIHGDSSGDLIYGGIGNDTIDGGSSADTIDGEGGNDSLIGGSSSDVLYGGEGNDLLWGGSSADVLDGGAGDDTIYGGSSADVMFGGTGRDIFVFNTGIGTSVDTVSDFNVADDTIWLDDAVFVGLAAGTLEVGAFVANTAGAAILVSHRIVYDTDSGALWFDADGSGAVAAVQFATLSTGLALTASDFFVT